MHHQYIFIRIFIEKLSFEYREPGVGDVFSGLHSLNDTIYIYCMVESVTNFSVDMYLLHQYKRNVSHLSYFSSLVIGLYKYEISAKII